MTSSMQRSARIGAQAVNAERAHAARQLFALGAGDTGRPEGADHSRLLHTTAATVPVRGRCAARFQVLEDTHQQQLLEQIRREVLLEARLTPRRRPRPGAGRDHSNLQRSYLRRLALSEAIRKRDPIMRWLESAGGSRRRDGRTVGRAWDRAERYAGRGGSRNYRSARICRRANGHRLSDFCATGSSNDQDQAKRFAAAAARTGNDAAVALFLDVLPAGR